MVTGSRYIKIISLWIGSAVLSVAEINAQDQQWERDGEIENVEIEIIRERQIILPRANRNFEKVPPRPAEPIKPEITYEFRNLNFIVPDYKSNVRPLRLKQEDISKIYGNYVSAGAGNFSSAYLDGWINTKRDKNRALGAHLYHRSFGKGPVDGRNSANANTELKVFGNAYTTSVASGGYLSYENKGGYFYGYTPGRETARDTIRQSYDLFSLGGSVSNTKPSDFNFNLHGNFNYLRDHYEAAESELGLRLDADYAVAENSKFILGADYYLIARKDVLIDAKPRHLFRVAPSFRFVPVENLALTLGANAVLENDSIRSKSFHLYPNLRADYQLSKQVSAYSALSGDISKVTLNSLSAENFWVNANVDVFHSNKTVEFVAGLKGKLGRKLGFDLGAVAANFKDLYFFQNSQADRAKFDMIYDRGDVQRVNMFAELGYNRNELVRLNLRGDYFAYSTDLQQEAWHRPTYRFNLNSTFNVYQKLMIYTALIGQGGMKAFDPETSQTVTLKTGVDLNAKVDYKVSKQVSVFVKLENMLSSDYPLYLNYPVRGFQALGGLSWSF